MGQLFIGLLLLAGGIIMYVNSTKAAEEKTSEIRYSQTIGVSEVCDVVETMTADDPKYRHYAEIKAAVYSTEPQIAPFCRKPAAYYENITYAVTEQAIRIVDARGVARIVTDQQEEEVARDRSSAAVYLTDESGIRIFVDIASLRENVQLINAYDHLEQDQGPGFYQGPVQGGPGHPFNNFPGHNGYYHNGPMQNGSRFLGYHRKEGILQEGQSVYVLGDVYKTGGLFYIGKSSIENKPSMLTYKSEEQVLDDADNQKKRSNAIGLIIAALGFMLIISALF